MNKKRLQKFNLDFCKVHEVSYTEEKRVLSESETFILLQCFDSQEDNYGLFEQIKKNYHLDRGNITALQIKWYILFDKDPDCPRLEILFNDIFSCHHREKLIYWIFIIGICEAMDELYHEHLAEAIANKKESNFSQEKIVLGFWSFMGKLLEKTDHPLLEKEIGDYYFEKAVPILEKIQDLFFRTDIQKEYLKAWYGKITDKLPTDYSACSFVGTYDLGYRILKRLTVKCFENSQLKKQLSVIPEILS